MKGDIKIMKKLLTNLLLVVLVFTFAGCSKSGPKPAVSTPQLTAEEISSKLKSQSLPIDNVIVYTEETDLNKLLGRPGQYISKVNFADTTLEQTGTDDPVGGSIETFKNSKDLRTRKEYIESVTESMPAFTEYMIVNGNYLLRLNKGLTPEQMNKYKEAFMKLK